MIFSFESFCNKIKRMSENKVKYAVYGSYYGDTWIILLVSFAFLELSMYTRYFIFFFFIVLFLVILFISSRKMGFGMGEKHFIYVPFYRFRFREKEVYEFSFQQIKYLNVKHFFSCCFVTISFLDIRGKFKKVHFFYNSFVLGLSIREQKENAKQISKKLLELQTILDRGDF